MTLDAAFARARTGRRAAFIPYVMAGDPNLDTSERILRALSEAGADAIELGIPYGDPLADGPTIAAAGGRALANGVGIADVLALARRHRDGSDVPIVLFTYFNPVYRYGIERFARDAARAGAGAAIVPDIPLEELHDLQQALAAAGLDMPLLVAPSSSIERARKIAERTSGFLYVVSRMGVTGAKSAPDVAPLRAQLERLRAITDKPLAVGFGVSDPEHVRAVTPFADGIIVGSALIDAYRDRTGEAAAQSIARLARSLVAAAGKP